MKLSYSLPRNADITARGLLVVAIIFAVVVRVRLCEFPLERDEGEFAYAGQLLLEGIPPYKLAYNMKLPGTYVAYAGLMAVFGQSTPGVHLGLLAVNLATIGFLYVLTRELFGPLRRAWRRWFTQFFRLVRRSWARPPTPRISSPYLRRRGHGCYGDISSRIGGGRRPSAG